MYTTASSDGRGGVAQDEDDGQMGAAGLSAVAGLMTTLLNQQQQREARERALKFQREQTAQDREAQMQQAHRASIANLGDGSPVKRLIEVLQRTAR